MLVVDGDIDASNIAELRSNIAWREGDTLHIDLHGCGFCGSDCLRLLVELCARSVDVHVWRPSRPVRRAIEVSGVDQIVTIHD